MACSGRYISKQANAGDTYVMFLALRKKLTVFDNHVNPFNRRGALRLSRYHPSAYTLLTTLMALGGYAYLYLFPVLLCTMPVALYFTLPAATSVQQWFLAGIELILMVVGFIVTVAVATMRFRLPSGLELTRRNSPRLFELLGELQDIYGHPRIDRVVLRDRFDMRIVKTPRHGFSTITAHTLVIGLPVLLTLSPMDVHVLLARRIGQLSGQGCRLNHWLYFLRDIWGQYLLKSSKRRGWPSRILFGFFSWYVPRYRALSLGAARQCELNADLYALQAVNDRDTARGITAKIMIDDYLTHTFWPEVLESATSSMKKHRQPHVYMAGIFEAGLPADEMRSLLKRVSRKRSNPKSIVPSLAERLANLAQRSPLLPKPVSVSAARFYLGGMYERCIEIVDKHASQKVRSTVIRKAGAGCN